MTQEYTLPQGSLEKAHLLVKYIENNNTEEAKKLVTELNAAIHPGVYTQVGKLARHLHEEIVGIQHEPSIEKLTHEEIPDTEERLRYVISLTEESANTTMDSLDACSQLAGKMASTVDELKSIPFSELTEERAEDFFNEVKSNMQQQVEFINKALLAQSYQDITGQIIQRTISMVNEIQTSLLTVLVTENESKEKDKKSDVDDGGVGCFGPAVTAKEKLETMSSQQDVDDLLSDLGF